LKLNYTSMLIIRLLRFGKKHKPSFRLILIEKGRRPGKYLENLGFYNSGEKKHKIEAEKIKNWISKGAQLTPTVHNILVEAKIIEGPKVKINISKSKKSLPAEKQARQALRQNQRLLQNPTSRPQKTKQSRLKPSRDRLRPPGQKQPNQPSLKI